MASARSIRVRPKWRLFRPGTGRASGPSPPLYVLLYLLCLAMSQWNAVRYGTIVVWPANGVALAALLQLHRREALRVLAGCFLLTLGANVVRGGVHASPSSRRPPSPSPLRRSESRPTLLRSNACSSACRHGSPSTRSA